MSAGAMLGASAFYNAVQGLRFDKSITGFEFKPSLGIVAKNIDDLGLALANHKEPLTESILTVMIPSIRKNFTSGGRPPWEELAHDTVRKRGTSKPILIRTGALRRGVTKIGIWSIGKTSATIRNLPENIWYGKVHQEGIEGDALSSGNWFAKYERAAIKRLGKEAKKSEITAEAFNIMDEGIKRHGPVRASRPGIPARPFVMFQDEDMDEIQEVFAEWMAQQAFKVGRFSANG